MSTVQEVVAAVAEARVRIKSGVLADVPSNGHALTAYLMKQNMEPTADNFYKAIVALKGSLIWIVKPAQLVVQESGSKPPVIENQLQAEAARAKIVKAGEQRDKDAKEHAALVAQCRGIIEGYNPTTRNGYDAREREEMQALWIKELHKAKEKSVEVMRVFTKSLVAKREKRYRDREQARERL